MREKIRTFSGIHMSPADPRPEEICIEDIAHALSLMTRANGHFPVFYSVAQHSLDCAAMAQAEGRSSREVLACLLHDASEAYLSDITRPVKGCLPEYRRIEQVLQEMIYEKYLIAPPTEREREIVKRMDIPACIMNLNISREKNYLMWHRRRRCCRNTGSARCGKWKKSFWHCLRN